jgi:hypothetical protein
VRKVEPGMWHAVMNKVDRETLNRYLVLDKACEQEAQPEFNSTQFVPTIITHSSDYNKRDYWRVLRELKRLQRTLDP